MSSSSPPPSSSPSPSSSISVIVGTYEGGLLGYDISLEGGACEKSFAFMSHLSSVGVLTHTPSNKVLLSGSTDEYIKIHDLSGKRTVNEVATYSGDVTSISISDLDDDKNYLGAFSGKDGQISILEPLMWTAAQKFDLPPHQKNSNNQNDDNVGTMPVYAIDMAWAPGSATQLLVLTNVGDCLLYSINKKKRNALEAQMMTPSIYVARHKINKPQPLQIFWITSQTFAVLTSTAIDIIYTADGTTSTLVKRFTCMTKAGTLIFLATSEGEICAYNTTDFEKSSDSSQGKNIDSKPLKIWKPWKDSKERIKALSCSVKPLSSTEPSATSPAATASSNIFIAAVNSSNSIALSQYDCGSNDISVLTILPSEGMPRICSLTSCMMIS